MSRNANRNYLLRSALAIVGAVIVFLGLNVGFGGILTLGWQGGSAPFFTVTDVPMFAVRDSHIRFIGGVWLALGLLMLAGSVALQRLRTVLVALTAMIFIGGLTRLTGGDFAVLLRPDVISSLLFEIALVPLLGLWIARAEKPPA